MKILYRLIGTFFGVGFCPIAPGTAASLVTVFVYKFFLYHWDWPYFLGTAALLYFIGVWAASRFSLEKKQKDPRTIVIDEVLGQWLALFSLPPTWGMMAAAFILFRIFDVLKPFFIRKAESFSRGWGIMLDDVLAGVYTSILINLYLLVK